jgi:hypothetical protein
MGNRFESVDEILGAGSAQDLFGQDFSTQAKSKYRRLMRLSHPDMFVDAGEKQRASAAFVKLNELWVVFTGKKTSAGKSALAKDTIRTRKHEYVTSLRTEDDVFQVFDATYDAGFENAQVLIAKSGNDSDLVNAYLDALGVIKAGVPDEYLKYFPTLIEKFSYDSSAGKLPSLVIEDWEGFYSLREVVEKYPAGLSPRHIAWIFRRMLVAIGNAADVGLVHGAPNLDAFYVNPSNHGVFLRNWQYSVKSGSSLVAVPSVSKADYPQSVFDKKPADWVVDVHIVAKTALLLMGDTKFVPFAAFFKGCLLNSVPHPAELLGEFDQIMDRVFGERRFVTFEM